MKTLVTGASGFIGSAVVRKLLGKNREVRCFIEPSAKRGNLEGLDVDVVEGDILDRDAVARALKGCDRLFHLAAIYAVWHPNPRRIYDVNVEGSRTILWAAYKAKLDRVVYTSSIAAVGHRTDRPSDESVEFNTWETATDYERSKWLSEREALQFAREGLPLTAVCPGFPFGERDIGPTPTGQALIDLLKGRLLGYPPGGISVIDVEDVAEGHLLAEEKGRIGARYILANHNVTYGELYGVAAEVARVRTPRRELPAWLLRRLGRLAEFRAKSTGKRPIITEKTMIYASRRAWFDNTAARTELGLPSTPMRDTLVRAIAWFRAHGYA